MKITKKQLRKIISETKNELINESRFGNVGIGFQGWSANQAPDFAKAYGKDARVLRDFGSNQDMQNNVKESRSMNALNNQAAASVEIVEKPSPPDLSLIWSIAFIQSTLGHEAQRK